VAALRRTDGAGRLVLVRHGQSPTNASGVFTGWLDVGLTRARRCEAFHAGGSLTAANLIPDVVYTSDLDRAITTADLLLSRVPRPRLPADLPRETHGAAHRTPLRRLDWTAQSRGPRQGRRRALPPVAQLPDRRPAPADSDRLTPPTGRGMAHTQIERHSCAQREPGRRDRAGPTGPRSMPAPACERRRHCPGRRPRKQPARNCSGPLRRGLLILT